METCLGCFAASLVIVGIGSFAARAAGQPKGAERPPQIIRRQSPALFLISDLRSGRDPSEGVKTTHGMYNGKLWNVPIIRDASGEHGVDFAKYKVIKVG